VLGCFANDTNLNRSIYHIQFVSQRLRRCQLIVLNHKQRPPPTGGKWIVDFEAPLRLMFHTNTLNRLMIQIRAGGRLFSIRQK
jgi:hypothetical protein